MWSEFSNHLQDYKAKEKNCCNYGLVKQMARNPRQDERTGGQTLKCVDITDEEGSEFNSVEKVSTILFRCGQI